MKSLMLGAFAVCALLLQTAPAFGANAAPSIRLVSLTPTHVAVAGANPRCYADAAVDGVAYWDMPSVAADQGVSGTTLVQIALNSSGGLTAEKIQSSSGNSLLDGAAMLSARMTHFTPELVNCAHVGGSYLYEVGF